MKNHNNNSGNNGTQAGEQMMSQGMQANNGVNQNQGFSGMQNQNPYYNNQNRQNDFNFNPNNNNNSHNPYYMANNNQVPHSHTLTSWLGQTSSDRFIRGLVIGAAATYLLTNEKAQKAIIKTGMKLYGAVAGGVEEIKEKIMDAKAQIEEDTCEECETEAK